MIGNGYHCPQKKSQHLVSDYAGEQMTINCYVVLVQVIAKNEEKNSVCNIPIYCVIEILKQGFVSKRKLTISFRVMKTLIVSYYDQPNMQARANHESYPI